MLVLASVFFRPARHEHVEVLPRAKATKGGHVRGYLHPDDRHLASAAEQANAFLSAAGQRKHARRSSPATRNL